MSVMKSRAYRASGVFRRTQKLFPKSRTVGNKIYFLKKFNIVSIENIYYIETLKMLAKQIKLSLLGIKTPP